jgi:hypothetical protein
LRLPRLIIKEIRFLLAQRTFVAISLVAPLLAFLVFYLLLPSDIMFPVEVLEPQSSAAREFTSFMSQLKNPAGTPYLDVQVVGPEEAERSLSTGERMALLEVPPELTHRDNGIARARVVLHYDKVNTNLIKNILDRVNLAVVRHLEYQELGSRRINIDGEPLYPVDIDWFRYMATGIYVYSLLLASSICGGIMVTREFEGGTMKLLRLAPSGTTRVYGAKVITAVLQAIVGASIFLIAANRFTEFWPTNWWSFSTASLLLMIIGALLVVLVAMVVQASLPLFLFLLVTNIAIWLIGGAFGPIVFFSETVQLIASILPTTYGMSIIRLTVFGGGLSSLLPNLAALTASALVLGGAVSVGHKHLVDRV